MPKISVILPVHNAEQFLREAIVSILDQSYADFELLVIDDGSTDNSIGIIKQFNDSRIQLFQNKHLGITKALNFGIAQAKGKYIARMDGDDVSEPSRFEKQVGFLDKNPEAAAVGCWYKLIDNKAEVVSKITPPTNSDAIKKAFFNSAPIVHPAAMIRKSVIDEINGYDEKFIYAQDRDLFLRILKKWQLGVIPEFLFNLRINKASISLSKEKSQKTFGLLALEQAIKNGVYPWYYSVLLQARKAVLSLPSPITKVKNSITRLLGIRHD